MATIQDRAFSRDYSGLRNQCAVGGVLVAVCLIGYELMRKMRRGGGLRAHDKKGEGIGSVETWEFGYLYQGRCWAKKPSPALPKWPLAWVKQAFQIPESTLRELLGIDATLYIKFLEACRQFALIHTCTTFPILFSIHIVLSPSDISLQSMDKASVSSLVQSQGGLRLLFVHVILAYWITATWILTLLWIARGSFHSRALEIQCAAEDLIWKLNEPGEMDDDANRGLRLRTVMVTNVPVPLRSEKAMKQYFEYYMSRPLGTAPIAPGFIPKIMAFIFNRAASSSVLQHSNVAADEEATNTVAKEADKQLPAMVERVVVARKMTELASLLERRQEILKKLEHVHIKLACKALKAARNHLDYPKEAAGSRGLLAWITTPRSWAGVTANTGQPDEESVAEAQSDLLAQSNIVADTLAPFVSEFHVPSSIPLSRIRHYAKPDFLSPTECYSRSPPAIRTPPRHNTVWEALHSLPRSSLDAYQPLINLSRLFRGQTVPAIDYYSAKLGMLTALINENRGRAHDAYPPSSTVFVTFEKIEDARRAVKYLQVHPRNPMACLVVPAPDVADLDWVRVMKSSYTGEFLKDWVVDLGVWAFTCSWIIPISLLVGLVNIQNLSLFIPGLRKYLQKHPRDQEAISSLLPTILVSIVTILIPMLLLLIAKKAHTIITLSKLHDTIMIRYWKFLICNLLIFFCVGVSALESFLQSFRNSVNPLSLIAYSFPSAGPFYVGWLILQTAIHGFIELGLYGLPLLLYPSTKAATTLRRRAACIRPRTFNFYYWLPNHVLVMTIAVCFALLNPLVIPFALIYFTVQSVIVKHQLVHVYAKTYDNNGQLILIRIVRYSLDGLILAHVVFLAFLVVLRETPEAGMTGVLLGATVIVKIVLTRLCRAKFAETAQAEDFVYSGGEHEFATPQATHKNDQGTVATSRAVMLGSLLPYGSARFWTWKTQPGDHFSYASVQPRPRRVARRAANPFGPNSNLTRNPSLEKPECSQSVIPKDPHSQELAFQEALQPPLIRRNTAATRRSTKPSVVTPHTKHAAWDDFPSLNRPYENPFYVAPIDNFLWLPRNPFGVLDLDDSVDMHEALTSEPGGGRFGLWMNETMDTRLSSLANLVETPSEMPTPESNDSDSVPSGFLFRAQRPLNGTEEISMPSILSERVNHIEREEDIDQATPHKSTLGRTSYDRRMSTTRRPSASDGRHGSLVHGVSQSLIRFPHESISGQSETSNSHSHSRRSQSTRHDPVNEPDVQAQAIFMEPSLSVSMSIHTTMGSRPINRHERASGPPVPLHEAVVGEIIAEEQVEAMDRIRREEEEQRVKDAQKPSWWNAWLWYRSPPTIHPEVSSGNNTS